YGTVGAVCLDRQGNLASASSTGGITGKRYGRVGDSPIVGAGVYADNATCAVSCTGEGEFFMRRVAANRVSALMEFRGLELESAAVEVLEGIRELGGKGGMIAVDKKGEVSVPFTTQGMFRGMIREKQPCRVAMFGPPGSWP
ncbi:MAG: isoaspartyl peptidase/L-asparaginase, partial [Desulfosalsimonas sp.]